jgi:transposase
MIGKWGCREVEITAVMRGHVYRHRRARFRPVVDGVSCLIAPRSRRVLSKLGEDITETLEVIPKSWKLIQHVREKFTCRDCEKIARRRHHST